MSMSPREVVREAVEFRRPPYVPWSFRFTEEAREKLEAHYGTRRVQGLFHLDPTPCPRMELNELRLDLRRVLCYLPGCCISHNP